MFHVVHWSMFTDSFLSVNAKTEYIEELKNLLELKIKFAVLCVLFYI